jgi:UDP-N-acetylmuramate--alanine ligase
VVAFQPHRFTRTRDLFDDFCEVLATADALLLTEVYAAGEARIPLYDGRALARGVRQRGAVSPVFVKSVADVPRALPPVLQDGDVLLTLGAGDIGALPALLASPRQKRKAPVGSARRPA